MFHASPFFLLGVRPMKRLIAALIAAVSLVSMTACEMGGKTKYTEYSFDYFDTATTLVGYAETKEEFNAICTEIKGLLKEYHQLYNIYNRYEGVTNLCTVNDLENGVHKTVQVDPKIMGLLTYARELHTLTEGKMNIAMGSVLSIWHQYRTEGTNNPENASLPPMEQLRAAAEHTDIRQMILNEEDSTVYLADPAMTLDVGAIAKGYATEQIALYLEEKGITGYILNVGGNVRCIGSHPNGDPWTVGIENPDTEKESEPHIAYLHLHDKSLVTSGSYQRYYTVNGIRYHHIIDPETLMPGTNFLSVSVLCTDSGRADALSTALFTMTYEEGSALVESLAEVEAMWVLPNGEQRYSTGFEDYTFDYRT